MMENKSRKDFLSRLILFLFEKQIRKGKKKWCKSFQEIVLIVGTLLLTLISLQSDNDIWSALIVAVLVVILYIGFQKVIDSFDHESEKEKNEKEAELLKYKSEQVNLRDKLESQIAQNNYLCDLYANIIALTDEIAEANKLQITKTLYTVLGSSIVDMITSYTGMTKKNFSVHIYGYDESTRTIRRLTVFSFVDSKQRASKDEPVSVDDALIRKRYYTRVMFDKDKKISTFHTNDEIVRNLDLDDEPDEIKKMYTQYAGMVYETGHGIKLYVEAISYNGVKLALKGKDLNDFVEKVIAPFSSPMLNVKWETIGR